MLRIFTEEADPNSYITVIIDDEELPNDDDGSAGDNETPAGAWLDWGHVTPDTDSLTNAAQSVTQHPDRMAIPEP